MKANMNHTSAAMNISSPNWFERFKRDGYYFRYAAMLTLTTGIYIHLTRLFLGTELLVQHILTPLFDQIFTIPMTYAAVSGLLAWRRIRFRGIWHKLACGWIVFYIGISGPVHIAMSYLGLIDLYEFLVRVPMWYSVSLLPVFVGLLILLKRLRFKEA